MVPSAFQGVASVAHTGEGLAGREHQVLETQRFSGRQGCGGTEASEGQAQAPQHPQRDTNLRYEKNDSKRSTFIYAH